MRSEKLHRKWTDDFIGFWFSHPLVFDIVLAIATPFSLYTAISHKVVQTELTTSDRLVVMQTFLATLGFAFALSFTGIGIALGGSGRRLKKVAAGADEDLAATIALCTTQCVLACIGLLFTMAFLGGAGPHESKYLIAAIFALGLSATGRLIAITYRLLFVHVRDLGDRGDDVLRGGGSASPKATPKRDATYVPSERPASPRRRRGDHRSSPEVADLGAARSSRKDLGSEQDHA